MKATKFFAAIVSIVMLLSAVGCKPEPAPAPGPDTDEQPCFKFEILDADKTSVSFRVTPLAKEMPYIVMIVDKASFDAFESVEAYIADDLAWFDQIAVGMGITLEDYLATVVTTGIVEDSGG